MPPTNYYVAESLTEENHFVVDLDEYNEPVFGTDYANALWATSETKVQEYINRFEINAKPKNPGFNYPPSVPSLP